MDTHLIQPFYSSEDYATRHKLLPFCKWVNLTHQDMFIHGPFEFASVNGQKTQECISQPDWDVLKAHCDMFHNPLPCFDVPSYLIRVYCGAHVTFHSDAIARQLIFLAPTNANDTPGAFHSPWQKVTASWANPTNFLHHYGGASSEVWHAEVAYLNVHFAGESEKWESMVHYDESLAFQLHFSSLPSLWLDMPRQVFLGRLREWDSLLLGRTVWPSSDPHWMMHLCVTQKNSELFHFRKH